MVCDSVRYFRGGKVNPRATGVRWRQWLRFRAFERARRRGLVAGCDCEYVAVAAAREGDKWRVAQRPSRSGFYESPSLCERVVSAPRRAPPPPPPSRRVRRTRVSAPAIIFDSTTMVAQPPSVCSRLVVVRLLAISGAVPACGYTRNSRPRTSLAVVARRLLHLDPTRLERAACKIDLFSTGARADAATLSAALRSSFRLFSSQSRASHRAIMDRYYLRCLAFACCCVSLANSLPTESKTFNRRESSYLKDFESKIVSAAKAGKRTELVYLQKLFESEILLVILKSLNDSVTDLDTISENLVSPADNLEDTSKSREKRSLSLVANLLGSSSAAKAASSSRNGATSSGDVGGGGSDSGSILNLITPLLGSSSGGSGNDGGGAESGEGGGGGGSDSGSILSLLAPLLGGSSGGGGGSGEGDSQDGGGGGGSGSILSLIASLLGSSSGGSGGSGEADNGSAGGGSDLSSILSISSSSSNSGGSDSASAASSTNAAHKR